jgi:hypothetical protein
LAVPDILVRIDDAILDRLQTIVARIHVRTGADKETVIRNVHIGNALFSLGWSLGAARLDAWFVLFPMVNLLNEALDAIAHHRRIGKAETARGYETAVREASEERIRNVVPRLLYLSIFTTFSVALLAVVTGAGPMNENAAALKHAAMMTFAIGPIGWQAGYVLAKFLKAVLPPHPGTRKAYDHIGSMVPE